MCGWLYYQNVRMSKFLLIATSSPCTTGGLLHVETAVSILMAHQRQQHHAWLIFKIQLLIVAIIDEWHRWTSRRCVIQSAALVKYPGTRGIRILFLQDERIQPTGTHREIAKKKQNKLSRYRPQGNDVRFSWIGKMTSTAADFTPYICWMTAAAAG